MLTKISVHKNLSSSHNYEAAKLLVMHMHCVPVIKAWTARHSQVPSSQRQGLGLVTATMTAAAVACWCHWFCYLDPRPPDPLFMLFFNSSDGQPAATCKHMSIIITVIQFSTGSMYYFGYAGGNYEVLAPSGKIMHWMRKHLEVQNDTNLLYYHADCQVWWGWGFAYTGVKKCFFFLSAHTSSERQVREQMLHRHYCRN